MKEIVEDVVTLLAKVEDQIENLQELANSCNGLKKLEPGEDFERDIDGLQKILAAMLEKRQAELKKLKAM